MKYEWKDAMKRIQSKCTLFTKVNQNRKPNQTKKIEKNRKTIPDPYIDVYLFAAQLLVLVVIDLFEDVGWWGGIANMNQLNIEVEGGLWWNDITSSTITIS